MIKPKRKALPLNEKYNSQYFEDDWLEQRLHMSWNELVESALSTNEDEE